MDPATAPRPTQVADSKQRTVGDQIKLIVDILQAILTISAILAAGWWFLKQESIKPQVKIEQTVTQRVLGNNPSENLITVDVRATNMGKTKVQLAEGEMEVSQINPIPGYSIVSYPLRALVLEPGESDQALFRTIRLNKSTLTVQIHSKYSVPNSKNIWNLLSAVDIGEKPTKKESAESIH
jgi:hypothetical protein